MSEMQATWRRPTSAARQGAQASPPPRPALETPRPQAFPSFRAPTAPAPGPRRRGRGSLGNLQAGRAGRRAGCGAFCAERPCRPVRLPRAIPSAPNASETPVSVPTLLPTPQRLWTPPGPPGMLGRIPLGGRLPEPRGCERYPRRRPAPGVRPSVPAGRGAKGRGPRRGPWVPATPDPQLPSPVAPRATCAEQAPHPPGSQLPPTPEGDAAPPPARRARCSLWPAPAPSLACLSIRTQKCHELFKNKNVFPQRHARKRREGYNNPSAEAQKRELAQSDLA